MAHYIAYAGKSRAVQPRQMMDEVKQMLALGVWAIPATTQLRNRLLPGDGLIIAVGKPYRRFVADAVVGSRYRAFTSSEVQGLPAGFKLDHGVSLTRVRVWQKRPWIEEVWPRTSASRRNPAAQFRQGITSITSSDVAHIVSAGVGENQDHVEPLPDKAITEIDGSSASTTASNASRSVIAAEPPISIAVDRNALPAHPSDSSVQRLAESAILAAVSARLGVTLAPRTLELPGGSRVDVDGAAADDSVFVEAFARHGALKGGQQKKVCQDALKLITLARVHPHARLVIAFADLEAAAYASRDTWVAEALATWGVEVVVVDLDEELRDRIRAAQLRQVMLNPPQSRDE
jgi:hypothetical protein